MTKNRIPIRKSLFAAGAALVLLGLQGNAVGAQCKGMEKPSCESSNSCTWVDSYQRKDGIKVAGYCRNKGGKQSSSGSGSGSGSS